MTKTTKRNSPAKNSPISNRKKRGNLRNKILLAGTIILLPLLFLYAYVAFYYHSHFYSKTVIDGISASNMTVSQVEDAINEEVRSYLLTLEGRGGLTDTISGDDINLHTVFEGCITDLLNKQNNLAWPVAMWKPQVLEINTMLEYDEEKLEKRFKKLEFLKKKNNIKPVNAYISEYGEKGYELIPEQPGAKVIKDQLYKAVQDAIDTLADKLSLEEIGCYEVPEITSDNPDLSKALEKMNQLASAAITYEFGDVTEVLDGKTISKWITLDDSYQVHFDESGIKDFVDYIGKNYNSFGRVRTFKTSYGKTIEIKGGDYGWWLNRPKEVEELTQLIKDGEKVTKEPAYFQVAQQYGKDDIGDTYVEVNLTAQHLYFYKEGKLILQTDFVSGNVSKGNGTPVGTYPVQYKDNDATLVGEDYETPVKYWMPFNKNIGFHDAYWRDEFGKDIYLTKGSHGCINMPPAKAKKMFQNIKRGVAVVVYELPGTENYDVDKDKDKSEQKDTSKKADTTNKTSSTNKTDTANSTDTSKTSDKTASTQGSPSN